MNPGLGDTVGRSRSGGVEVAKVTAWFRDHVPDVEPPLAFELIAGGRSNLTSRVTDRSGASWVLRRPPRGDLLPTAHDMEREHRIISALAGTDVPVPPAVGLCTDVSVDGAPFYVMDHVDGLVLRDQAAVDAVGVATRRRAGLAMAETLAAIHRIDPHEVGLGDLGREEGYVARQLRRWNGQFLSSGGHDRSVVEAFERLSVAVPEQGAAALVHGDYRLDNCMIDDAGEILAVLDWELCTLGDPLADLGLMLVYWTEPTDGFCAHPAGPTTVAEGFPDRAEIVAAYTAAGGRTPEQLEYYVALGFWKLACILQGVATRYDAGAMGDDGARAETFGAMVTTLGAAALATLDSIGTPIPWARHL